MIKYFIGIFFYCLFLNSIAQSNSWPIAYEETFSNNDENWPIRDNEDVKANVKNGLYILQHHRSSGNYFFYNSATIDYNRDFSIEVVLTQLSSEDDDGFGIVWGYKNPENYNSFLITEHGSYHIYGYKKDSLYHIKPWTKSVFTNPNGKANKLRIDQRNHVLHFYINDHHVHSCHPYEFYDLRYGFEMYHRTKIAVDRVTIRQYWPPINLAHGMKPFQKINLGPLNSKWSEKSPIISPDGKTIYYTREDHPDNIGDITHDDIWYSTIIGDDITKWSNAKNIGRPLNNDGNNHMVSVTPDNNVGFLKGGYDHDGEVDGDGFSITHRTDDGWSVPVKVKMENFYNLNDYEEANMSADGKTILLCVERDDTYGGKDIYVSFLQDDNTWSEPKNIGPVVNTFSDEIGPFLAADGMTLYYATDGKPGYGSHDLFLTRRLDDTWQHWTEPQNLGPSINSKKWDSYYATDASGKIAVMCTSNGNMHEDIYLLKVPEEARPKPVVLVYGKVLHAKTKKPIEAGIRYEDLSTHKEVGIARSSPSNGDYKIVLPYGQNYGYHADVPGFIAVNENMNLIAIHEYQEIKKDLYLVPIEDGEAIQLNNIFFAQAKSELLRESYPELDRLFQVMLKNHSMKIQIQGHTDNVGNPTDNMKLSEERANAVRAYLIQKGISPSRILAKGLGDTSPIYTGNDTELHKTNRRVEFIIIKK